MKTLFKSTLIIGMLMMALPVFCFDNPELQPTFKSGFIWCPEGSETDSGYYDFSPEEHCQVAVIGSKVIVTHFDAVYNCCIDDIFIDVTLENNVIQVDEYEVFTNPCYCYCYFQTSVTVFNVPSGEYTVEVWSHWENGDSDLRCQEEIEIGGLTSLVSAGQ